VERVEKFSAGAGTARLRQVAFSLEQNYRTIPLGRAGRLTGRRKQTIGTQAGSSSG